MNAVHRLLAAVLALAVSVAAAAPPLHLAAQGSVQVAFTPGDDAGALVVEAIRAARRQVLVQAFSLTHRAIADALTESWRRGVDVRILADQQQAQTLKTSLVDELASAGVPVWLDGEHASAHNKVMVLDAGTPEAAVVTGSYNFTHAAQYRNAENLLVVRGNPLLAEAYAANWRRHSIHSHPLRRR